jgi:four helix bundle protein
MSKKPPKSVFEKSLEQTDFFKGQKEQYLKNKAIFDEERRKKQEAKADPIFHNNICHKKAQALAVKIIKLCQSLMEKKDYTILSPLCSQIVRSSTSIYANMSEGAYNYVSSKEKANRFVIACREAYETLSWLSLLYEIGEITEDTYVELKEDLIEIIRILSKSITTLRSKIK